MKDGQWIESLNVTNTISPLTISYQRWISLTTNRKNTVTFTDGTQSGTESEYVQCFYKMVDDKYLAIMTMQAGIDAHIDNCDFFVKNLSNIQILLK
jgi:hypothetical protein